ncbi:type IV secretion system coupling TraD/TrwB family protein [Lutibacter oceani]|uniref:Type IV secretion system coupling TraD/TrwB family protein n=1 Tax=Lutibacter oceani TaxID=1853311 RepID=A0A3D9RLC0_9FLAO|nr:type IV secretion system DNA-binding domain-containing protein [Lutibacter oceani]REE80679.1 type IV secretion system coupling TraD/TrwB family protein [Lutibacter oceani]
MTLSPSEQLTLNFYKWESKGRGYFHSPFQVKIEPPFIPFQHQFIQNERIDEGRVPSLFNKFIKLIQPEEEVKEIEEAEILPLREKEKSLISTFEISYSKKQKTSREISLELLNMLSYSKDTLSFEIVATGTEIKIQISCNQEDSIRVQSLLKAYFPSLLIKEASSYEFPLNNENEIAICDFGLEEEFMRTIQIKQNFSLDPFTSLFSVFDSIENGDAIVFQVLFKGVEYPWAKNILNAVTDYQGNSFFSDSPEMLTCAKNKISQPLFAVVLRVATQSIYQNKTEYLAKEVIRNLTLISSSEFNRVIPLSNEGYDFNEHMKNLFFRQTNRTGMILNSEELLNFVHYPNENINTSKLNYSVSKTKKAPQEVLQADYKIGVNEHNNHPSSVYLTDEQLVQHAHIIGATGVGKSTLLANLTIETITKGVGVTLFDPHGDIVEDILLRIPEHRKDDVIIIDPSDSEFPVGFNLLQAKTDTEKIVLSSDLVSAFKSHATAWGDNMTAVLSNAINTFLESSRVGTLIELKRFLIEEKFRNDFLHSVEDESLHYYWNYEYPMVKKGIAPLLTRIDTFLRPKIIRYMFAQKDGIDFKKCIDENKIVLIKLSQGLIGNENSYLLGSLFLSKINQVALGRQNILKENRKPYFVIMDEFHSFITPSISSILSGARKYSIGLVLAHQNLRQIQNSEILESIISNPFIRIAFRLGDNDAKILEGGFSYFEKEDLTNLEIGEAIVRTGKNSNDFNLKTHKLSVEIGESTRAYIIQSTRENYSKNVFEVEQILKEQLPRLTTSKTVPKKDTKFIEPIELKENITPIIENQDDVIIDLKSDIDKSKEKYLKSVNAQDEITKHRALQNYIKTMAVQRGFRSTIEEELKNGGKVDVGISKSNVRIGIEVSVTNTIDYEVQNLTKCIDDGFNLIYMISESKIHLKNIEKRAKEIIEKKHLKKIFFFQSIELIDYLDAIETEDEKKVEKVNGWRVNVNYHSENKDLEGKSTLSEKILKALKSKE